MGGITHLPQWGALWGASNAPHDTPMLFFDNLVKKTRQTITVNQLQTLISIHLHWNYVLIIC